MTVTVPRHQIGYPNARLALEMLDEDVSLSLSDSPLASSGLNNLLDTTLMAAHLSWLADPRAAELGSWERTVRAMQVASAIFAAANADSGTVECMIGDEVRALQGTGPEYYTGPGNWVTALWLSIICRESNRIDMLAGTPVDLLRQSSPAHDDYIFDWVDVLQSYWKEEPGLGSKLTAAMEGTDPEAARATDREYLLKIAFPPIDLFYRFFLERHDEFNSTLAEALELHRDYWSSDEERAGKPDGGVSLPLLALTCLAHDAGFPIEVESEYMPAHLIKRSWLGEFPT